jgi:hypothetical protein
LCANRSRVTQRSTAEYLYNLLTGNDFFSHACPEHVGFFDYLDDGGFGSENVGTQDSYGSIEHAMDKNCAGGMLCDVPGGCARRPHHHFGFTKRFAF